MAMIIQSNYLASDSLYASLFHIMTHDNYPEICRETASLILLDTFNVIFSKSPCSSSPTLLGSKAKQHQQFDVKTHFVTHLYMQLCSSINQRFSPILCTQNSTSSHSSRCNTESSEEIRLYFIKLVSIIATYMADCDILSHPYHDHDHDHIHPADTLRNETYSSTMTQSTSLLCEALYKSALWDPYPLLKKQSILLIQALVRTFPHVIQSHAEQFLLPITGGPTQCGSIYTVADANCGDGASSNTSCQSTSSLLRHRHAQIRSLAIQVTTDIISCCINPFPYNWTTGTHFLRAESHFPSSNHHLPHLLLTFVLPNFEMFPSFDHSTTVRIALIKAAGNLLTKILPKEIIDNDNSYHPSNKNIIPTWHIASLVIALDFEIVSIIVSGTCR